MVGDTAAKLRIVFGIRPYPEFSWSISRQRLLENCPRAYCYRYYLSHNGWLREAPERAQIAYRLSKLTSLDALLGQEMDERAREVETAIAGGDKTAAQEALKNAQPEMARGVARGVLHKNTVARKMSRLSKRVAAL